MTDPLLTAMEAAGFDSPTTGASSNPPENDDEAIEFENTSGLARKYLNLTVGELLKIKGGLANLKDWASYYKTMVTADKADQDMRERRNELIEKDFAVSNLKKYIDLFMDDVFNLSESQTEEIISLVLADVEKARNEIPKLRMKGYSKVSKSAKTSLTKSINRLSRKYESDETPD